MNKGQANLQDIFLNQLRKENIGVTIYLVTGAQLKGNIKGFDSFTVVLDSPGKPPQLVYKHALASVVPSKMFNFRIETSSSAPAEEPPAAEQESQEQD